MYIVLSIIVAFSLGYSLGRLDNLINVLSAYVNKSKDYIHKTQRPKIEVFQSKDYIPDTKD